MDDEVVIFCQTQIINSGLVLDEDLVFVQMVERKVGKPVSTFTRRFIYLATAACSTLWTIKKGGDRVRIWTTGLLFVIPAATTFLLSYYRSKRAESRKEMIIQLLSEFRNLSRVHSEVTEFLKCFSFSMDTLNNPYTRLSEETIFDLSKSSCDLQVQITNEMQNVISKIHVGLQDVSLDLTEFQKATAVSLIHDTILGCLRNCNFVEGQIVLLRSHLLTSLFLVSSSKGDRDVFLKVLDKVIPPLMNILRESVIEIRIALNKTRFPVNRPLLSLPKIENIFAQRRMVCVPRMKKHVIKINDGICCTFMKLRVLLETLDNVDSESQMLFLQEAVSTLTHELHRCYMSAADLEKLIELLNRNPIRTDSRTNVTFVPKENTETPERVAFESEEPVDDSDYQVFATGICDDDNEGHAVRFYKRFMKNDVDWLAELKQSDEFQRRQTKFHTRLPVTSTPPEPSEDYIEDAAFKSSISLQGPYSLTQIISPPPPPPMPRAFPVDVSDIVDESLTLPENTEYFSPRENINSSAPIVKVEHANPLTTVESSVLLDTLKGVLDKMGPREEDEFE